MPNCAGRGAGLQEGSEFSSKAAERRSIAAKSRSLFPPIPAKCGSFNCHLATGSSLGAETRTGAGLAVPQSFGAKTQPAVGGGRRLATVHSLAKPCRESVPGQFSAADPFRIRSEFGLRVCSPLLQG